MSFWENREAENDEENQEDEDDEFKSSNDRIIFLIDARASMFSANHKEELYIKNCLRVALEVMKTKIVAQDSSSIGVTFFGSAHKDSAESTDHVFTLFPLAPPNAQRIRQLKSLLDDWDSFVEQVGSQPAEKAAVPLKQALWTCSQSFATKDLKKNDLKRVWLFTNDDQPNGAYPVEQRAIVTVARDCAQAGIELSLWHMNRPEHVFNPSLFFTQLLVATSLDSAESSEASIDHRMLGGGFDGFDAMMASVRRKEHRKRRLSSLLFSLGPAGAEDAQAERMGVQLFKTLQVAKKPLHTWLSSRTNEPLKSVSRFYDATTGETLETQDIETFVDVAGSRIALTRDEMNAIKRGTEESGEAITLSAQEKNDEPAPGQMELLFMIPLQHFLMCELNVDTPYFLYPDDKSVAGSNALFEALLRECVAAQAVPIVKFAYNKSAVPRQAALFAQAESVDEDGCQLAPPGFYVLPLPFAEDLRFNPLPEDCAGLEADKDLVDLAGRLVDAFSLSEDFSHCKDIESPSMQQFYSILQSVALNESEMEFDVENDDKMRPPKEMLNDPQFQELCAQFSETLGLSADVLEGVATKRRKPAGESSRGTTKKAKQEAEDDGGGMSDQQVRDLIRSGKLAKLLVADLKDICRKAGLPLGGKKDDLVARVTQAFS